MLQGQPLSLGFQISKFLAKLYINIYQHLYISIYRNKIRTIPSVVSEKYYGQKFGDFGHAIGPALEKYILIFETCCTTSYPYQPFPQISEQSVLWLLRPHTDKI